MIIKSIEPIAELDLEQVLFFTTQKLVLTNKSLDKSTHQNIVIAKYSDGKAYVIHNFGNKVNLAEKANKALNSLVFHVSEHTNRITVDVSPQLEN